MLHLFLFAAASTWTWWIEPCSQLVANSCVAADADLAAWALDAWSRATQGAIRFERVSDPKLARMKFYWAGARPGLYGEARMVDFHGERGAEIYLRGGVARHEDPITRDVVLYMTCLHESGHGLGLGHTAEFDDIMYNFQYGGDLQEYFNRWRRKLKSREDLKAMGGYSAADAQRLQRVLAYAKAF